MNTCTLAHAVGHTTYPGRGIVAGLSNDGKYALLGYFIMGRSLNSRNRIFVEVDQGLRTQAFDESQMVDPSLIIYNPVLTLGKYTIVTNGDQTDTIYNHLKDGGSFESALRTRTFEPDAPNFTPRVSCLCTVEEGKASLQMGILKAGDKDGATVRRFFYDYDGLIPGEGYFLHTYMGDGNPIPSFEGEPEHVVMADNLDDFTRTLWANLNVDNKVSLWCRSIELATGKCETVILNKHQGQ